MTEHIRWLSTTEFAETCGITPQAARKALRAGLHGRPWRDRPLQVRRALGVGGRSGLGYEVALTSMPGDPAALTQASYPAGQAAVSAPRSKANAQDAILLARLEIITPAISHPAQSAGRAEAIARASMETWKTRRTLYRWLSQYEAHGLRGLARARPSNAGHCRVQVSRQFDDAFRAAGYGDDTLARIAADLGKAL
jgi:hypothetical protein